MDATENHRATAAALPQRLLTASETAELLGCSVRWVYRQVAAHQLPALRVAGSLRFDPTDLAAWLRSQRTAT